MKIYNALSKSFTDEVKEKMKGGGKSIDEAFEEVKMSIFGWDLSPTPTPEPTPLQTTPPPIDVNELTRGDGEENGFYYVDLGLSVKWATCNVGASLASDDGLLFQFGRVDGYRYKDTNHQFRTTTQNEQDTGNRHIPKTTSGKTYAAGATLGLADDAAHENMGGNWRMPTGSYNSSTGRNEGECGELLNNTEKSVVTVNGVEGILFTSNKNGHKLFIPFMQGYWDGYNNTFSAFRSYVYMWSSQVRSSKDSDAYTLDYSSSGNGRVGNKYRTYGFPVRGVF